MARDQPLKKKKEPELEIIEDNEEDGLGALVNSTVDNMRKAGGPSYICTENWPKHSKD